MLDAVYACNFKDCIGLMFRSPTGFPGMYQALQPIAGPDAAKSRCGSRQQGRRKIVHLALKTLHLLLRLFDLAIQRFDVVAQLLYAVMVDQPFSAHAKAAALITVNLPLGALLALVHGQLRGTHLDAAVWARRSAMRARFDMAVQSFHGDPGVAAYAVVRAPHVESGNHVVHDGHHGHQLRWGAPLATHGAASGTEACTVHQPAVYALRAEHVAAGAFDGFPVHAEANRAHQFLRWPGLEVVHRVDGRVCGQICSPTGDPGGTWPEMRADGNTVRPEVPPERGHCQFAF